MSKVSVLRNTEQDALLDDATGADRRRFDRAEVTVRVDYASVDELFSDFTRDINEGGLFISTHSPLELGSRVALQFALPRSDESVHVKGTVVWARPGDDPEADDPEAGMGIEFDELEESEREKINQIVRNLRAQPD